MLVKNNSHYFNDLSRMYNLVPDNHSFESESCKRLGYFQRLYYEFLYTSKIGGITFFYTLTYNDIHIPQYNGHNVFSYDDIRYITNGKLSKDLKRKYNCKLKYFCACEAGEGKGKRGLGNNPHYHFIFFVQPSLDGAVCPSPLEFRDMIRVLWHGKTGFVDYNNAKYGICKEGDNLGVVQSPEAFRYVGKYVIKSAYFDSLESEVASKARLHVLKQGITLDVLYNYYVWCRFFGVDFTKYEFNKRHDIIGFNHFRHTHQPFYHGDMSYKVFVENHPDLEVKAHYLDLLSWFNEFYVDKYVRFRVMEFRNKYGCKVRISKSVGEYGLQCVRYVSGKPKFFIPYKDGYQIQSVCLYYIRHLYYDVHKCPISGNVLYRLNKDGIKYRLDNLENDISTFINKVDCNIKSAFLCPAISENVKTFLSSLIHEDKFSFILRAYAVHHLVYEFRHYNNAYHISLTDDLSIDGIKRDYDNFLRFSLHWLDYDSDTCYFVKLRDNIYRFSFSDLPVFKQYRFYFGLIDSVLESLNKYNSDKKKQDFSERSDHQKRMKSFEYNCFQSLLTSVI